MVFINKDNTLKVYPMRINKSCSRFLKYPRTKNYKLLKCILFNFSLIIDQQLKNN